MGGTTSIQMGRCAAVVALGTDEMPSSDDVTESLQTIARKLAMHVVAAQPRFLNEVPEDELAKERLILTDTLKEGDSSGKPAHILEKIVEGRLNKFISEVTLLRQGHMAEPDSPQISKVLAAASKQLGLKLTLEGFALYNVSANDSS